MSDPYALLQSLAEQLPMLSDDDQQFILGCQASVSIAQMPLTKPQAERLHRISASLQMMEHNTMDLGAPLSIPKVVRDLAGAVHMLTPAEHAHALKVSRLVAKGAPLTTEDIERLINIHAAKGF